MLIEPARIVVQVPERVVVRGAGVDEATHAVGEDARPPAGAENRLQRLLPRLLRLEAGPFVVAGGGAVLGGGQIRARLIEPRPPQDVTAGHPCYHDTSAPHRQPTGR